MGGEGTERLFNALFVSDIRVYLMKNGKLAPVEGGNVKSRLSHKCEKAHGFQGDSLAAGVGTGDDQKIKIVPQTDVYGYSLLLMDERMAGFAQVDAALLIKDRLASVHIHGERASGKNKIKLHHKFQVKGDRLPFRRDLFA